MHNYKNDVDIKTPMKLQFKRAQPYFKYIQIFIDLGNVNARSINSIKNSEITLFSCPKTYNFFYYPIKWQQTPNVILKWDFHYNYINLFSNYPQAVTKFPLFFTLVLASKFLFGLGVKSTSFTVGLSLHVFLSLVLS